MSDYLQGDSAKDFIPSEVDEIMDEAHENTIDNNNLPEAAASANIKCWINGFGVMFTMRANKVKDVVREVEFMLELAASRKWQPTWETKILPKDTPTTATPTCGIHGTSMKWLSGISKKTGKPYAFWSCATKNADGSYCSYSPPKEIA